MVDSMTIEIGNPISCHLDVASSNTLATWCKELTHLKRPWCWGKLKAGGEGDDRGWNGWMASPTQWAWVWVSSGRWWRTGKTGVLQSMRLQRFGHDWATEQQQYYTICNWVESTDMKESRIWRADQKLYVNFQLCGRAVHLTTTFAQGSTISYIWITLGFCKSLEQAIFFIWPSKQDCEVEMSTLFLVKWLRTF